MAFQEAASFGHDDLSKRRSAKAKGILHGTQKPGGFLEKDREEGDLFFVNQSLTG